MEIIQLSQQSKINLQKKLAFILDCFGLGVKEVGEAQNGYRNRSFHITTTDHQEVNILFYKKEPRILSLIRSANYISDFLALHRFPSRRTFKQSGKSIIKIKQNQAEYFACVYSYLSGSTISWDAYTSAHIKLLGGAMGKMHTLLENLPQYCLPDAVIELQALNREMKDYFARAEVIAAITLKLNLSVNLICFKYFEALFDKLLKIPSQPLHLDFVRGNILFQEDNKPGDKFKISGVLDFEKAAYGPKVIDIARTLAFLLIDCKYKSPEKVRKYFLYNGYQKRGKNKVVDLKYLNMLLNFFWFYDFYKFLKHNPYEFLEHNEHYVRTRNVLLQHSLLDFLCENYKIA